MSSNYREEDKRLEQLKSGSEAHWRQLYAELRAPFRLYFIRYGTPPEAATEMYQDAMVILDRNIRSGSLSAPLQSSLSTYVIGIGRMLLKRQGADTRMWDGEMPELPVLPTVEEAQERQAQADLVQRLLGRIGSPCKELLELFYIKGYVMEAIAETLGLPSAGAARRRKHDCLRRLRELLQNNH